SCPAIPDALMESELFGHARGAFTGAARSYPGKLRQADGGTLMLDEIAELPLDLQPKLLRFLEERSFQPLGENRTVRVNIRLISATNRDLEQMVADGHFREDLFYRLNTITLEIPPLRDRSEDILPLARHFLTCAARRHGKAGEVKISPEVERILLRHDWPGNVRELRNAMEHVAVFLNGQEIGIDDLPPRLRGRARTARPRRHTPLPAESGSRHNTIPGETSGFTQDAVGSSSRFDAVERQLLLNALENTGWNITAAARELGVTRNVVRYRIAKYGLDEAKKAKRHTR
ncbi:MAG: sigma 54-interacting transcriptional regulator, partial [Spirochaetota bacterium]